jgi:hypothetical protein
MCLSTFVIREKPRDCPAAAKLVSFPSQQPPYLLITADELSEFSESECVTYMRSICVILLKYRFLRDQESEKTHKSFIPGFYRITSFVKGLT